MTITNKFEYCDLESKRFNYKIFRGTFDDIVLKEIKSIILNNEADILILRLPVTNKDNHSTLQKLNFPILHCDTLVYYTSNLLRLDIKESKNNLKFEIINTNNAYVLDELIPIIFSNYKNHYFSNPSLPKGKILEGYVEWAKSYISSQNPNKISWLVKKNNDIVGFATCSSDKENNTCEGILYGVLPQFSGEGIYSDIIRFTQKHYQKLGYEKMLVSTQIQNFAVQKVWTREGFSLLNAFDTYHINPFLSFSINSPIELPLIIKETDIDNFAEFSGDRNELHMTSEYAQANGFDDRIAHGMISSLFFSKYFGVTNPGPGTIILNYTCNYYKPLYPNTAYTCKILFTLENETSGFKRATCLIKNDQGEVNAIFYFDLIKK